jgi:hypothetical protein
VEDEERRQPIHRVGRAHALVPPQAAGEGFEPSSLTDPELRFACFQHVLVCSAIMLICRCFTKISAVECPPRTSLYQLGCTVQGLAALHLRACVLSLDCLPLVDASAAGIPRVTREESAEYSRRR